MKPPGYGEAHPRLDDDRLPVVLVVLDGLGDRPIPELGGRTPSEAAATPVLDRLTRRGASGWHVPFGWGRAPSSELAHWAMFGFRGVPFPGRAVLEALGAGIEIPIGVAVTFAALRTAQVVDGHAWITGRAASGDHDDAERLLAEIAGVLDRHHGDLQRLGQGEAILTFPAFTDGDVTDSDPFFEEFHPWLQVQPIGSGSAAFARELNEVLAEVRQLLLGRAVNRQRRQAGRPALDVLTTKWSGARQAIPDFVTQAGVAGAAVTGTRLYRGLATLLGLTGRDRRAVADLAVDMAARVDDAEQLIAGGARFVHVHTKATDEAGHSKQHRAKLEALEAIDSGLAGLEALADRAVVAVTGDHATPSVDGVLHTADPTPLLLVGPTVRADDVERFGERYAHRGWFGVVAAEDLLPLCFGHANRPVFLGHRTTPAPTLALPDTPIAMPLT